VVGFARESAKGDLGGVEQAAAGVFADGFDDHSSGDAGDESADSLAAGEGRHGIAELLLITVCACWA